MKKNKLLVSLLVGGLSVVTVGATGAFALKAEACHSYDYTYPSCNSSTCTTTVEPYSNCNPPVMSKPDSVTIDSVMKNLKENIHENTHVNIFTNCTPNCSTSDYDCNCSKDYDNNNQEQNESETSKSETCTSCSEDLSSEELSSEDLSSEELSSEDLSSEDLSSEELSSEELSSEDLSSEELSSEELSSEDLSSEELSSEELSSEDLSSEELPPDSSLIVDSVPSSDNPYTGYFLGFGIPTFIAVIAGSAFIIKKKLMK